jgi:hypothetical protein
MPFPVKLLALRPGSAGPGWQEWHIDFRLEGLSGPAHESVLVTVRPRAPLDRPDQALSEGRMLLARLATDLAVVAEAHARGTPPKEED